MSVSSPVVPVILSGGSGTRLWPASRKHYPKQLLRLAGSPSMLQQTALRVAHLSAPLVVCNDDQRFMVAEQLASRGQRPAAIILEPVARNTAPAIALAAMQALAQHADPILVVLPADHLIQEEARFRLALETAIEQASRDHLVVFGVQPDKPETGYGYIRADGGSASGAPVREFVEKPDAATAADYLASGEYFWNSGMFVFRARVFLEELGRYEPAILSACQKAFDAAVVDLDFMRLSLEHLDQCPSQSIDYAVMEHTDRAWMVPLDLPWNDLGSWSSIWDVLDKDADHNVIIGAVDDRLQLRLLDGGNLELVQRLLEVIHESVPFVRRDVQIFVRITHRSSSVLLRPARRPANHFGDKILETRRRHFVMCFVYCRVRIQTGIIHDAIDEIIDDCGNCEYATESFVQGGFVL